MADATDHKESKPTHQIVDALKRQAARRRTTREKRLPPLKNNLGMREGEVRNTTSHTERRRHRTEEGTPRTLTRNEVDLLWIPLPKET
ncbi:MAG: hypothetical protein KIH08_15615 [Candidatus Freyarchaeota archaeon]|nr:hypothetical protein [Candidatus Jordarchaeia archaeon]MBS7281637.1 hypothetical protein [Candidatus Jordarchaeia archaeon]